MIFDQADPPRLFATDRLGGEQQPRRLPRPDQGDEPLYILLWEADADLRRRDREFGGARRDPDVAGHGQRDAGAVAMALDQGDRRNGERAQPVERAAHILAEAGDGRLVAAQRGKVAKVGAGAKGAAGAGHDQHPGVASFDRREPLGELGPARRRNGVAGFGPIERQPGMVVISFEEEHEAGMARAPGFVAQKKAGLPDTRQPGHIVPRRPVRWRRGPRANVGAITTAPRPVAENRARAVPERNPAGCDG